MPRTAFITAPAQKGIRTSQEYKFIIIIRFAQGLADTKKDIVLYRTISRHQGRKAHSVCTDYSALQQSFTEQLSQSAHFVLSHSAALSQSAHFSESQFPQHSVAAADSHSDLELQLLHAHEDAATIAAAIAKDINTFFMVIYIKRVKQNTNLQK